MEKKLCKGVCGKEKPLSDFHKHPHTKDRRQIYCKECVRTKFGTANLVSATKWYVENKGRWRDGELRRQYGITSEDYARLLKEQNDSCAICKRHASQFKKRLSVDHSHTTGEVRGLLCQPCNLALGNLQEDLERIANMVKYLAR